MLRSRNNNKANLPTLTGPRPLSPMCLFLSHFPPWYKSDSLLQHFGTGEARLLCIGHLDDAHLSAPRGFSRCTGRVIFKDLQRQTESDAVVSADIQDHLVVRGLDNTALQGGGGAEFLGQSRDELVSDALTFQWWLECGRRHGLDGRGFGIHQAQTEAYLG